MTPVDFPNRPVILIAEDEKIGRETLAMILESRYDLYFASNGDEALTMAEKIQPDCILMDLMMPVMNGYQALNEIRKLFGNHKIPVIAVTARAMKGEKEKILDFGFDGYIAKPVNEDLLITLIDSHLTESIREES